MVAPTAVNDPNLSDSEFRLWCALQVRGRWAREVEGALLYEGTAAELAASLPWSVRKVQRCLHDLRDPSRGNGTRGIIYAASVPGRCIQVARLPYPCDPRQRAEYKPRAQRALEVEQAHAAELASRAEDHAHQAREAGRVASATAPQPLYPSRAAAEQARARAGQAAVDQARHRAEEAACHPAPDPEQARARARRRAAVPQSAAGRELVEALAASGEVEVDTLRASVHGSSEAGAGELTLWCASRYQAAELGRMVGESASRLAGRVVRFQAWLGMLLCLLAVPQLAGPLQHRGPEPATVELGDDQPLEQRSILDRDQAQLTQHPRDQRRRRLVPAFPPGDRRRADAQQGSKGRLREMQPPPQVAELGRDAVLELRVQRVVHPLLLPAEVRPAT